MKQQKALFLDRDGVINIDHGYVSKIEDFEFSKGIFELLKLFISKGYLIFIVTNQSGIGRGYYSEEDFFSLTKSMLTAFKKETIHITKVKHCPHAPEEFCQCRKPNTGMIDDITEHYGINLSTSWLIGDKQSDIDLAMNATIPNTIAITSSTLKNATYTFASISACNEYFKKLKNIL